MKIFISSLIAGFGSQRQAAKAGVTTLRHEPVMAEDFGALPTSPQVACLQGLRQSDMVVLVLGDSYGAVQPGSGLSATHEEYREARQTKPVLAFVQQGVTPDPQQAAFIAEVQGWEGGLFRGGFDDSADLQAGVIRALHDNAVATVVGAVDPQDLARRATGLIPPESRNMVSAASLDVAIAAGPTQRILRPVEIEAPALADSMLQTALFGQNQIFDRALGNEVGLAGGALTITQERGGSLKLDEQGSLLVQLPLDGTERRRGGMDMGGMMVLLEEVIQAKLSTAIGYAAAAIEHIDPTQRITDVAIAARISGAEYRAWRTQAQHAASPGSVTIGHAGNRERVPVVTVQRRAALRLDRTRLVEDLLVPLRRQFPSG